MDEQLCVSCENAIRIKDDEGEEFYCRLMDSQMESVRECSAYVPEGELLTASTEELGKFLVTHFGAELSEETSLKGAALTIAKRYLRLKDEGRSLIRFMETRGTKPPREPGESVFDWIKRGFLMGAEEPEPKPVGIELPDAPELEDLPPRGSVRRSP